MTPAAAQFFVTLGWDNDIVYKEIPTYSDELLKELEPLLADRGEPPSGWHATLNDAALIWVRSEMKKRGLRGETRQETR